MVTGGLLQNQKLWTRAFVCKLPFSELAGPTLLSLRKPSLLFQPTTMGITKELGPCRSLGLILVAEVHDGLPPLHSRVLILKYLT